MRRHILVYILILISAVVHGQPAEGRCFYSEKRGLIFTHKLILLKLDSQRYLMEYYTYGGGIFSGGPSSDTLLMDNGVLKTKAYYLVVNKDRMVIKSKKGRRKFKYRVLDACDPIVNRTRNWSVRETLRYKIKDQLLAEKFWSETEPMLSRYCYTEFLHRVKEMENAYLREGLNEIGAHEKQ